MKKWLRTALVIVLIICTLPISAFAAVENDNASTYNLEGQVNINQFEVEADSDTALKAELVTSMGVGDNAILETEPNNNSSTANNIYDDYTVQGAISATNDVDVYKFTVTQISDFFILVMCESNSTAFGIVNSNGEVIVENITNDYYKGTDNFGELSCTLTSGTYYLLLLNNSTTCRYTFYNTIKPIKPGWRQTNGKWMYITKVEGNSCYVWKNGWQKISNKWYLFDSDGYAKTGWQKDGGKWYYFDTTNCDMKTGWVNDSSRWYYCNSSGAMVTGWQKIGGVWYYFKSSGAMVTGWQKIGGKYYAFNNSGAMLTGWVASGGYWYYCNSSGAMVTGWVKTGGKWYYMIPNSGSLYGAAAAGWWRIGGKWYYFNTTNGDMYTGNHYIGGRLYRFNSSGACLNP